MAEALDHSPKTFCGSSASGLRWFQTLMGENFGSAVRKHVPLGKVHFVKSNLSSQELESFFWFHYLHATMAFWFWIWTGRAVINHFIWFIVTFVGSTRAGIRLCFSSEVLPEFVEVTLWEIQHCKASKRTWCCHDANAAAWTLQGKSARKNLDFLICGAWRVSWTSVM